MSAKPLLPLSPIAGCLVASGVAAAIGMGGWAAFEGVGDPALLFMMTLIGGWPVATALALLAGTQVLPPVTARFGFRWWTVALTGALTGVVPTLAVMLLGAGRAWGEGNAVDLALWGHPLAVAGLAGAAGGFVFWTVSGEGQA